MHFKLHLFALCEKYIITNRPILFREISAIFRNVGPACVFLQQDKKIRDVYVYLIIVTCKYLAFKTYSKNCLCMILYCRRKLC